MTTTKRWTEETIRNLVQTNDGVLYGALINLYRRQTATEKRDGVTRMKNGVGFNGCDANFLSSLATFYLRNGYLTYRQKVVARRKMVKYTKQLTRIANKEI